MSHTFVEIVNEVFAKFWSLRFEIEACSSENRFIKIVGQVKDKKIK